MTLPFDALRSDLLRRRRCTRTTDNTSRLRRLKNRMMDYPPVGRSSPSSSPLAVRVVRPIRLSAETNTFSPMASAKVERAISMVTSKLASLEETGRWLRRHGQPVLGGAGTFSSTAKSRSFHGDHDTETRLNRLRVWRAE